MQILILHGPNLNLFGRREPEIYGTTTLAQIDARLEKLAKELKVKLEILQSNHEGELIDKLHQSFDTVQGAIINAGGLTHTSVSLHDAIKAMPFPVLEVHMSNLAAREPWRKHSAISPAVAGTIQGLGVHSYTAALRAIVEVIPDLKKKRSRASSR
jgi:3-dehydroquinate dehydratase-2